MVPLVLALSVAAVLPADAVTWSGAGSDANWTSGSNWVGGSVPGTGLAATFDNTATNKAVDIGAATIANNVTISLNGKMESVHRAAFTTDYTDFN